MSSAHHRRNIGAHVGLVVHDVAAWVVARRIRAAAGGEAKRARCDHVAGGIGQWRWRRAPAHGVGAARGQCRSGYKGENRPRTPGIVRGRGITVPDIASGDGAARPGDGHIALQRLIHVGAELELNHRICSYTRGAIGDTGRDHRGRRHVCCVLGVEVLAVIAEVVARGVFDYIRAVADEFDVVLRVDGQRAAGSNRHHPARGVHTERDPNCHLAARVAFQVEQHGRIGGGAGDEGVAVHRLAKDHGEVAVDGHSAVGSVVAVRTAGIQARAEGDDRRRGNRNRLNGETAGNQLR